MNPLSRLLQDASRTAPGRSEGRPDAVLLVVVVALLVLGLVMIQSASGPYATDRIGDSLYFVKRQGMAIGLGLVGATALALTPHAFLRRHVVVFYLLVLLGLVLVFVPGVGRSVNGASRWIGLGVVNLQPSEFAKLAVAASLAVFLERHQGRLHDVRRVLGPALLIPLPMMALVLMEPDFGSTVILAAITGLALYLGGLRSSWILGLFAGGLAVGAPAMLFATYRLRRLESFLDPWKDASGSGYQVIQSMTAYHEGGLAGKGLGAGHAKHFFLPEPWTDFVSAVLGEELGFLGVGVLLALYTLFVWRGLRVAWRSPDLGGLILAATVTGVLGAQALLNLGVAMGILPPKGLVLPFVSYGGSAVMAHLAGVGLLLHLSMRGVDQPAPSAEVRPEVTA